MPKDFSKRIRHDFTNSPMYQEHDEKIEQVLDGQNENAYFEDPTQPIQPSQAAVQQAQTVAQPVVNPQPEPAAAAPEEYKNVGVKMPLHIYEQLTRLKYFSGRGKTTIAEMVITATEAWVTEQLKEVNKK